MLGDGRELADGSIVRTDVCIVGGGPAGITLALELSGSGLDVVVLESGGVDGPGDAQALNAGRTDGLPYFALDDTRFRGLGGSSHRWAGWCRPLDAIDLETRSWVPHSGWPFGIEELAGPYDAAAGWCQLRSDEFDPPSGAPWSPVYGPPYVGGDIRPVVWQGSPPTKFGAAYRQRLVRAPDVRVLAWSTAVAVRLDPDGGRVEAVEVATTVGATTDASTAATTERTRFRVEADTVVLAAGAIETARLLLVSDDVVPAGVGNGHDLVGRFFLEHPHVPTGRLVLPSAEQRPDLAAVSRGLLGARQRLAMQRPAERAKVAYATSPDVQRRDGLLNWSAHLNVGSTEARAGSEAYRSLRLIVGNLRDARGLLEQLRRGTLPEGVGQHLGNVLRSPREVADVLGREVLARPQELEVYAQAEQRPNPDSRVTIDRAERDPLGVPRVVLSWRMTPDDRSSLRRSQGLLSEQLRVAGLGHIEPAEWLDSDDGWSPVLSGGHHHLGTARMAASPREGVVDATGRVHGVGNLYVGDSAVFPTGGFANPMLTVVAMAVRLAAHLRQRAGRPTPEVTDVERAG